MWIEQHREERLTRTLARTQETHTHKHTHTHTHTQTQHR
jgi:hypothetical protein